MKEETRYRVTGSLFLLALAVICLPMLLDGAGVPARELPDVALPESLQASAPQGSPGSAEAPGKIGVGAAGGGDVGNGPVTGSGDPAEHPGSRSDLVDRIERLRAQVDDEGFMEGGTRFGEPVLSAEGPQTKVWAVQVASFARSDNAEGLRQRLRSDGYEAFLSTVKSGDAVLRRVAVGPMLDRDRADALRGELSTRYDVRARLMQFSN